MVVKSIFYNDFFARHTHTQNRGNVSSYLEKLIALLIYNSFAMGDV